MPVIGNKTHHPQSLSIRLHAGGFSFFVCDTHTNTLVLGEHFTLSDEQNLAERLTLELSKNEYHNAQIESVNVLVCTPSTRVPLEEFHREEAATLYNYIFTPAPQKQRISYTILPQLESVELYAIPVDAEQSILKTYPSASFYASQAMLQERLLRFHTDNPTQQLFCCFLPEALHLYAFQKGRLCFGNTLPFSNQDNLQYYILNAWNKLHFNNASDELFLLATKEDPSVQLLSKQLVKFLDNVVNLKSNDIFSNAPLTKEKEMPLDLMALLLNRI